MVSPVEKSRKKENVISGFFSKLGKNHAKPGLLREPKKGNSDMVRELVHDPIFLGGKSAPTGREDLHIAQDLRDTLQAHLDSCVGMAANMIGQRKRIIAFVEDGKIVVMLNPQILKKAQPYETEEGCLSLLGGPRKTLRYEKIKVEYETENFQKRLKTYTGWTAQIIQHELDHCDGILI